MPDSKHCPHCGEALSADAPDGLCLRCLVQLGAAEPVTASQTVPDRTTVVPLHVSEKPGDRIGRYKLLEQIGEGGCGVVYVAEQEQPVRRRVALKVIKLGMDTRQVIARFEAERQALALMDHPNIAKVLDAGATETGRPYFVMELVKGIPITRYCDENELNTQQRLTLFIQVCQAIQHAHQKGIIHRDIKPSNVLVADHDGTAVPKIIDFGIAKATTDQRLTDKTLYTAIEQFIGTPAYMSPEQAKLSGLDVDTRSDIYSLGVLLYELLTSKTPFDAKRLIEAGLDEIRRIIREEEPPRPSTRLSTLEAAERTTIAKRRHSEPPKLLGLLRGDLDWIVMKALEKDRTRRYETANGFASDIQRYLRDEPVLAGPPTTRYRLKKFVRKHQAAVTVAASFFLLLMIATGVSTWLAVWANRERANAARAGDQARENAEAESKAKAEALREKRAAELARKEAELEARRRLDALTGMQIQRAEDLFTADDSTRAVPYLASVLTSDPSNRVAAERLLSALTFRNYCLPLSQPLRHEDSVHSAQFSTDGLRLLTASSDKTARVWDAWTGKLLIEPLRHDGKVSSAQFSPDGLRVITVSGKTARVWDAWTGKPLTEPLWHKESVHSAQFSPDSLRVVTSSIDTNLWVWDAQTGKPLTEPLPHEDMVSSAQFSPDGLRVVTTSANETARVWDVQTGKPLGEPLRHEGGCISAQFSPDGLRVVTAGGEDTARVWDVKTATPLAQPLRHEDMVWFAQFSPDGLRVVTASFDKTARVWDAQTGKPISEPLRHGDKVFSAQFSPDGLRVLTASFDKTARVWDAQTGKPLTEPLRQVNSAQFSPHGLRVVTASDDKAAQVWDAQSGEQLTEPVRHGDSVLSAHFGPNGLRVVMVSRDKTARVWEGQTGKPLTEPLQHKHMVFFAEFSPDGKRVITTSFDKTARIWDAQTGKPITESLQHEHLVFSAQFSPDGLRVVTASRDKTARIWDAQTGKPITEPLRHEDRVHSAQFSPNGLRVVTASDDKTARVWDAQTGKPLTEPLRHEDGIHSAQFSSDGLRVVTASDGKTARVWDAQTGKPITEPLRHEDRVHSAQFSPNGLRVVTASEDKTARVWDVQTGKPLSEPLRHEGRVRSAQFSPDGLRVVTGSDDKTARVWDVQTGLPLTEPLQHEGWVGSAQFSPDGLWVFTTTYKTARVWEVPFGSVPAPPWLPRLAEAVVGRRLTGRSVLEPVAPEEFVKLKEQLIRDPATNYYARWAKWFLADRGTRTISPLSTITVPEHLRRLVEENTLASLREAVQLCPTNAIALARLALALSEPQKTTNAVPTGESDWLIRRATQLSPADPIVLRARATLLDRPAGSQKP